MSKLVTNRWWIGLLALLALAACSDDDGGTGPAASALHGTWNSTSLVANGMDAANLGMAMSFTFNSNDTYSFSVTQDELDLCGGATDCSDSGTYSATGTTLTFDPGSSDATTLSWSVSGDTLSVTGMVDGVNLSFTFVRA